MSAAAGFCPVEEEEVPLEPHSPRSHPSKRSSVSEDDTERQSPAVVLRVNVPDPQSLKGSIPSRATPKRFRDPALLSPFDRSNTEDF